MVDIKRTSYSDVNTNKKDLKKRSTKGITLGQSNQGDNGGQGAALGDASGVGASTTNKTNGITLGQSNQLDNNLRVTRDPNKPISTISSNTGELGGKLSKFNTLREPLNNSTISRSNSTQRVIATDPIDPINQEVNSIKRPYIQNDLNNKRFNNNPETSKIKQGQLNRGNLGDNSSNNYSVTDLQSSKPSLELTGYNGDGSLRTTKGTVSKNVADKLGSSVSGSFGVVPKGNGIVFGSGNDVGYLGSNQKEGSNQTLFGRPINKNIDYSNLQPTGQRVRTRDYQRGFNTRLDQAGQDLINSAMSPGKLNSSSASKRAAANRQLKLALGIEEADIKREVGQSTANTARQANVNNSNTSRQNQELASQTSLANNLNTNRTTDLNNTLNRQERLGSSQTKALADTYKQNISNKKDVIGLNKADTDLALKLVSSDQTGNPLYSTQSKVDAWTRQFQGRTMNQSSLQAIFPEYFDGVSSDAAINALRKDPRTSKLFNQKARQAVVAENLR